MRTKVNWHLVWKHFDAWCENHHPPKCKTCGYVPWNDTFEWDVQQAKIVEFVEKDLQGKLK